MQVRVSMDFNSGICIFVLVLYLLGMPFQKLQCVEKLVPGVLLLYLVVVVSSALER